MPLKDIPKLSPAHHAAHHRAPHHPAAHGGSGWGHKAQPIIEIHLNGSKGKLSHEEIAGVSHEIGRALALA